MERRVTGNCHARCEAGEKREMTSNSYLSLFSFPTLIYMSLPKSTSDLRQSSRRSLRPGQTKPVNVIFFVYPTMEWRLLRLMAKKMQASLMVEGKLPGEGLVSFGEQEDEDEQDIYVQLAREVLASLEEDCVVDQEEEASELQKLFTANAAIEREKNQTLGDTVSADAVEFDPIRVEPLTVSADFSPQKCQLQSSGLALVQDLSPLEPTNTESSTYLEENLSSSAEPPVEKQPVRNKRAASSSIGKETVTIIHTSVTAGKDPWADLRKKYLVPKRKRKNTTISPEVPTLWSHFESEQMEETDEMPVSVSTTEKEGDMSAIPHYLW
jgi:hypothetical protein